MARFKITHIAYVKQTDWTDEFVGIEVGDLYRGTMYYPTNEPSYFLTEGNYKLDPSQITLFEKSTWLAKFLWLRWTLE